MTRKWCHCGAPLRPEPQWGLDTYTGCRVCGIEQWIAANRRERTRCQRGISFLPGEDPNSTDDTAATSRMLPVGCHYPYAVQRIEDDAETVGQWLSERYLIWPTTFLWQA